MTFRPKAEGLQLIILIFILASFFITVGLIVEIIIGDSQNPPHGGVSSPSELCSSLGVKMLKKGGNAMDAAITTTLCLGLVEPYGTGIGGGGFAVIHDHRNTSHATTVLDFREEAPNDILQAIPAASTDLNDIFQKRPGLSVGAPGLLPGLSRAYKMHGHLPWHDLFAPVIALAESGFEVSPNLANYLEQKFASSVTLPKEFLTLFTNYATGKSYRAGDRMIRRDLGQILGEIAKIDVQTVNEKFLAAEITEAVNRYGGVMTNEDIMKYGVVERTALTGQFSGYTVVTVPAPSSGSLLLYTLDKIDSVAANQPLATEYLAELAKITRNAYRCRSLLGDPDADDQVEINQRLITNSSESDSDICRMSSLFTDVTDHGTSHVSVVDRNEMLVSITTSLNNRFGSGIVTKSGIILNDELADFAGSSAKNNYNRIGPGKRPLSSMVPTVLFNERRPCQLRMAIGGINGTRILSSVAQSIVNMVKFGMNAQQAIDSPKIYCTSDFCEIEEFDGVVEKVGEIAKITGVPFKIVGKKLAGLGAASKIKSQIDAYFDASLNGKAIQY